MEGTAVGLICLVAFYFAAAAPAPHDTLAAVYIIRTRFSAPVLETPLGTGHDHDLKLGRHYCLRTPEQGRISASPPPPAESRQRPDEESAPSSNNHRWCGRFGLAGCMYTGWPPSAPTLLVQSNASPAASLPPDVRVCGTVRFQTWCGCDICTDLH